MMFCANVKRNQRAEKMQIADWRNAARWRGEFCGKKKKEKSINRQ